MEFKKLSTKEDFLKLKKSDTIIVKWNDNAVKHNKTLKKIMLYNIFDIHADDEEIICQKKGNHYFNYDLCSNGLSSAEEVFLVVEKQEHGQDGMVKK